MKITIRQFAWLAGGVLAFGLYNVYAAQGTVIDGSTGKPMAGVHVAAAWTGTSVMPVQQTTRCYHAEAAVTDERGRFKLSSFTGNWDPLLLGRSREVWAIAPGYQTSPQGNVGDLAIVLVPATGSRAERFKALPDPFLISCEADKRIFIPFWRTLHLESLRLANNRQERIAADRHLFDIEFVELGEREAMKRANARTREENFRGEQ
ncbi:MAG TPA: hypothetical protein PLD37_02215 [Usitatibacteraceae bacterium]|nr:hypothetical protein [Usitatibacteraceae bacterium]